MCSLYHDQAILVNNWAHATYKGLWLYYILYRYYEKKLTPYFLYFTCMKYLSGSVINPLQIGFLQAMYLFASLLPSPLIPSYWLPFKHSKKNTPNMEGNLLSSPYVRERKYTFRVLNNNPHKKKLSTLILELSSQKENQLATPPPQTFMSYSPPSMLLELNPYGKTLYWNWCSRFH